MIVRDCDDCLVGFQPKDDTEQFLRALRDRFARFYLALHSAKTRLIECGRWASARRQRRGQGKPEPFDCLGGTPRCRQTRPGQLPVRRKTVATRLRQQWQEIKQTRRERMPWPSRQLGAGLKSGLTGPDRYDGGPRNMRRLRVFRERILR